MAHTEKAFPLGQATQGGCAVSMWGLPILRGHSPEQPHPSCLALSLLLHSQTRDSLRPPDQVIL